MGGLQEGDLIVRAPTRVNATFGWWHKRTSLSGIFIPYRSGDEEGQPVGSRSAELPARSLAGSESLTRPAYATRFARI
jgi:hypothetical protein